MNTAVIKNFSMHAYEYNQHAYVQHLAATRLSNYLLDWRKDLIDGPVLEIGCGTGFTTNYLLKHFPDRDLTITDASFAMLNCCQNHLSSLINHHQGRLEFSTLDASNPQINKKFALIVAGFSLHWLGELEQVILSLQELLDDNGMLVFSVPVKGSFVEWENQCKKIGVPFTANCLPNPSALTRTTKDCPFELKEDSLKMNYANALDFFVALKRAGSTTQLNNKSLSPSSFRSLLKGWDKDSPQGVEVSYKILFGKVIK